MSDSNIVLNVNGIEVIYNHVILVLKGVSLQVPEGKVVALFPAGGVATANSPVRNRARASTSQNPATLMPETRVSQPAIPVWNKSHAARPASVPQNSEGAS